MVRPLPRRARRSEIGVRHHDEGQRVERRRDPIVKLCPDLVGLIDEHRVGPRRVKKLPEISLTHRIFQALFVVGEPRQVEAVAVEQHDRGIALAGLVPLHGAILQHEEQAALVLYDIALLGENAGTLFRVALIVDEDPHQLSVGAPFANVKGQPLFELGEAARLHDVRHEIGADLGRPPPQLAQAPGRNVDADAATSSDTTTRRPGRDGTGSHGGMPDAFITMSSESLPSLLSTCATAIISAIGAMIRTSSGTMRPVMPMKTRMLLPLIRHQVDVTQCLRDPHERGHAGANDQERTERGAKNIAADGPHPNYASPLAAKPRCAGCMPPAAPQW
jgi:hypothetical protein